MDKFERFEQWLLENGAHFSMLELRAYDDGSKKKKSMEEENDSAEEKKETTKNDGGTDTNTDTNNSEENHHDTVVKDDSEMRGVHAKVNIPPNAVCVAIPRKCLITVEMGQATKIGQTILKSNLDLDAPKHIFLMIFLLWDRNVNGDKSFFKPYYDILPQTLRNIPIFWTEEELGYLKGSYLLTQIADRNDAITEDYHAICAVAPELKSIATLEEFKWARMCVCSRNFGLQINGHRTSALVPHADMFNHYRPRETKWTYDDEMQAFTITTLQMIPNGAQVYDSYGQKCNHRFLLNYGFAVEDNTELDGFCPNEVPIELTLPLDDPLYNEKFEFFVRGEDDGSSAGNITNKLIGHHHQDHAINTSSSISVLPSHMGDNLTAGLPTDMQINVGSGRKHNREPDLSHASMNTDHSQTRMMESLSKRIRVCVSNNENTKVLFSMLRVFACNREELNSISTPQDLSLGGNGCPAYVARALRGLSDSNPGMSLSHHVAFYRTFRDIRHPISVQNEKRAMNLLLDIIGKALDSYTCSLAQDVSDLMDESKYPLFSNERHGKIQVRGEKEVLHHYALWARTSIEILAVLEREIAIEKGERSENIPPGGFEYVVRRMEEENDISDELHPTIVRYCTDILGSLHREEIKKVRRARSTER